MNLYPLSEEERILQMVSSLLAAWGSRKDAPFKARLSGKKVDDAPEWIYLNSWNFVIFNHGCVYFVLGQFSVLSMEILLSDIFIKSYFSIL